MKGEGLRHNHKLGIGCGRHTDCLEQRFKHKQEREGWVHHLKDIENLRVLVNVEFKSKAYHPRVKFLAVLDGPFP